MTSREKLIEELLHSFHAIRNITKAKALDLGHHHHITHSQWFVLTLIKQFKRRSIKDIAESLEMSSSAATQLVDPLVQNGLVIRQEDPEDRRQVQLELSTEGKEHIEATKQKRIDEMGGIFDSLNDDELADFVRLHKKITHGFSGRKS
jgi:DNA-binding MarR family transcriptional regulator